MTRTPLIGGVYPRVGAVTPAAHAAALLLASTAGGLLDALALLSLIGDWRR